MREVLIGDLAYVQLATVLQIMENEQLSGWIQTRAGTVVVRNGLIVDVDVDGLPHADAMMHMLDQETGGFIVEAGTPPNQRPLGTVPALLMQAAQLKDEWQRIRGQVLEVADTLEPALASAERWFDGRRTLEEVVRTAGLHVSEVVDAAANAISSGILVAAGTNTPQTSTPELVHASADE